MKLKIGIDSYKPGWVIVLKQIGVNFEQVALSKSLSPNDFLVIIITKNTTVKENEFIQNYLNAGGAVLYADDATLENISYKRKKVRSLYSQENTPFSQIGFVDIYSKIRIPSSKKVKIVDSGLNITSLNAGNNLILPFNINELILNCNTRRKKFYASRKELPSELVSEVSKGKLRKIVELSLEYLHHKRDLPFVHFWHQPFIDKSLFVFRLDTDFCSKEDADKMYKICENNNISATWFLDTESDDRLENYTLMQDQEMAIHCDKHYVYDSYEDNYENIKRADEKLKKHSIKATGFAAPFGDWNFPLDKALQRMAFKYSSEFALDYDNLPFYPYNNGKVSSVMQIPIHPISLGRLRRSHFTQEEMFKYYINIIKEKKLTGEPVIIYHHPHHQHFEIFEEIFRFVNSNDFTTMNMNEFSIWWSERDKLEPEFIYSDNELVAKYNSEKVFIRISTKNGFAITENGTTRIDEITLKPHPKPTNKHDFKRTRKFHWRDLLYNHESRRSKNYFK